MASLVATGTAKYFCGNESGLRSILCNTDVEKWGEITSDWNSKIGWMRSRDLCKYLTRVDPSEKAVEKNRIE